MAVLITPGETSQWTSFAVRLNTLTAPSIAGWRGWPPRPAVLAGKASVDRLWASAICWADIEPMPLMPAIEPPEVPATRVALMPRSLCPGTVHQAAYVPAFSAGRARVADAP